MTIRIGRRAKMLCPVCKVMSAARQENDNDTVHLKCGHSRTPALLDSQPGTIGLENILAGDGLAVRLFSTEVVVAKAKERKKK